MQNCKKRVTWKDVLVSLFGYVVDMGHRPLGCLSRRSKPSQAVVRGSSKDALTKWEQPRTSGEKSEILSSSTSGRTAGSSRDI